MSKSLISVIKIVLAVTTIVFSAKVSFDVPLGGEQIVPVTLQSLVILCWAVFLSPLESLIAVGTYILMGSVGNLPVFANGAHGMEVLKGDTGGFIWGFLVAAMVVSWVKNPYRKETFLSLMFLMIIGTAIIIIGGLMQLTLRRSVLKALDAGFYPIWKGAVIKIVVGTIICFIIEKILESTGVRKFNTQ